MLSDGGVVLVAERDYGNYEVTNPRSYTDHWLLRFEADGRLSSRTLLTGSRPGTVDTVDRVRAVAVAPDGSLVMVGETIWPWHPETGGRDDSWLRRVELP